MICRNPEAELVALADHKNRNELGLEEFRVPFFNSPETLLDSGLDFEVVNIATPNGLHATHAMVCLENGKHVIIEKPLALHSKDAADLASLAHSKGLRVFPVMQ